MPSPRMMVVASPKRALLVSLHDDSVPIHDRSGWRHGSHNHRMRGALLKLYMSWMARPPSSTSGQTVGQLTLKLPPVSSSCAHRKRRMHLSMSLKNIFGAHRTVRVEGGIARTQRARIHLAAIGKSLPFHHVSHALMRSRMNRRCTRRSLVMMIGRDEGGVLKSGDLAFQSYFILYTLLSRIFVLFSYMKMERHDFASLCSCICLRTPATFIP